jgi:hypothetical protein
MVRARTTPVVMTAARITASVLYAVAATPSTKDSQKVKIPGTIKILLVAVFQ